MITQERALVPGEFFAATRAALEESPLAWISAPGHLASREAANGSARLEFHSAIISGMGQLRITCIDGPRVGVFNAMIFPDDVAALPVFASEIVTFGKAVRIAVIDLQPLHPRCSAPTSCLGRLLEVERRYAPFRGGLELPAWAQEHFTPLAIHYRAEDGSALPDLLEAYIEYLEIYKSWHRECGASSPPRDEPPALRHYKDHHIANSPGLNYLGKVFGEEWTRDFLRHGMYS